MCEALQRAAASEVVDHIVPVERAPELFWEPSNWQAMSKRCHSRKTMIEDGGFGRGGAGSVYRPSWLPLPRCRVVLVCGAPAAGKSTYIERNAADSDRVICLDAIAQAISGQAGHDWDRSRWLGAAIDERNRQLATLETAPRDMTAWVPMTLASVADRIWWRNKLRAKVLVVMADEGTCQQRMRERGVDETKLGAVTLWFQRYRPGVDEHIVTTENP